MLNNRVKGFQFIVMSTQKDYESFPLQILTNMPTKWSKYVEQDPKAQDYRDLTAANTKHCQHGREAGGPVRMSLS